MLLEATYYCCYCGEEIATGVDPSGGAIQEYTEDCQVCCRPNVLRITIDEEGEEIIAIIDAQPEMDSS